MKLLPFAVVVAGLLTYTYISFLVGGLQCDIVLTRKFACDDIWSITTPSDENLRYIVGGVKMRCKGAKHVLVEFCQSESDRQLFVRMRAGFSAGKTAIRDMVDWTTFDAPHISAIDLYRDYYMGGMVIFAIGFATVQMLMARLC